ncbi:hypothetical protein ANDA3_4075 [plant metagenome]|uniref:Uncharacterized protein n=2 Tax=root TaxID=1 RepID=A0A1C3K2N5_9BURK|nr:hypothetical protein ODI_01389 [Orrella dioscoreae]SOE52040.1 hypothetical protein ODI_R3876 [Orrella dioscoreae]
MQPQASADTVAQPRPPHRMHAMTWSAAQYTRFEAEHSRLFLVAEKP